MISKTSAFHEAGGAALTTEKLTLAAVEAFIRLRQKSLEFPPWLEQQFELDMRSRRSERLRANTLHTLLVYDLFLVGVWLLVPDALTLALVLHLLVVTPCCSSPG